MKVQTMRKSQVELNSNGFERVSVNELMHEDIVRKNKIKLNLEKLS